MAMSLGKCKPLRRAVRYYWSVTSKPEIPRKCINCVKFSNAPKEAHSANAVGNRAHDLHSRLSGIEEALTKRLEKAGFQRSKRFYGTVMTSSVIVFVGGYLYFFPHKLRQQVVEEVSTVASQSLEDQKIVTKAGQLSKDVLTDILNDSNTKNVSSDFVKEIIVSQPIREAAISTILDLLNDPRVLELLRTRLSTIILGILQNDSTREIVVSQVNTIIQHESVRLSLKVLLKDLMETPEVQAMMADFFRDVLASDTVKNQGITLGQKVTSDVISDKDIQEQAGKAIWAAVKYSFTPALFYGKSSSTEDSGMKKTGVDNETPTMDVPTGPESPLVDNEM